MRIHRNPVRLTCGEKVPDLERVADVGAGRLGSVVAIALRAAGLRVDGPLRRGEGTSWSGCAHRADRAWRHATVAKHREALRNRTPDLVALYDAMTTALDALFRAIPNARSLAS